MNRRGFLSLLGAAGAGAVLDPERLLWVQGRKKIFIPSPTSWVDEITFDFKTVPPGTISLGTYSVSQVLDNFSDMLGFNWKVACNGDIVFTRTENSSIIHATRDDVMYAAHVVAASVGNTL